MHNSFAEILRLRESLRFQFHSANALFFVGYTQQSAVFSKLTNRPAEFPPAVGALAVAHFEKSSSMGPALHACASPVHMLIAAIADAVADAKRVVDRVGLFPSGVY